MAEGQSNIGTNPTTAANVDFGGIMNQGLDRLVQNKERDRLAAEREAKRNQEFEDRYGINEDDYVLEDTEFRTVNDTATEAVSMYRDRYYDVYTQLKADPNNIQLKKRLGKISNSVKSLSASNNKIKEIGEQYVAMMEEDKISGVDEDKWREVLEATEDGRVKVSMDEDDNMQYMFYNKDGKLQDVMAFKELIGGTLTEKVDLDESLDALVDSIGTDQIDQVTGRFITSSNVFGADQKRFVNDFIDSYVGTDAKSLENNPVLADLLNQATGGSSKKKSNFTEQERQFVKNFLLQQTKDRYDETVKLKERQQPRAVSAADRKQPKAADINIAFQGSAPKRDADGNFVFTIAKPVAVDPTKSDRKIDTIKADAQGNLTVTGEDRVKVKGVQDDSVETVADREGVQPSMIEELLSSDGSVQYFKRVPFSANSTDDSALINKIGNMFGVEDELGLRNILYQDMVSKFGQEVADRLVAEPAPQRQATAPKKVQTESGNTYE